MIKMPKFEFLPIYTRNRPWYKQWLKMLSRTRKVRLLEDYKVWVPCLGIEILIPKGFVTNLASIPRWLWWLIPPDGIFMIASIAHDFGYQYDCFLSATGHVLFVGKPKGFFDKAFNSVNAYVNGMGGLDSFATKALTLFGWRAWWRCRRANADVTKDFAVI